MCSRTLLHGKQRSFSEGQTENAKQKREQRSNYKLFRSRQLLLMAPQHLSLAHQQLRCLSRCHLPPLGPRTVPLCFHPFSFFLPKHLLANTHHDRPPQVEPNRLLTTSISHIQRTSSRIPHSIDSILTWTFYNIYFNKIVHSLMSSERLRADECPHNITCFMI